MELKIACGIINFPHRNCFFNGFLRSKNMLSARIRAKSTRGAGRPWKDGYAFTHNSHCLKIDVLQSRRSWKEKIRSKKLFFFRGEVTGEESKGQMISKANYGILNPSLKWTNKFVLTSMRLVFVCFLQEIEDTKKTFRNYLTIKGQ